MFSGGAVFIEQLTAEGWRRFRPAVIILIALAAGILAPCFVPILPIDHVVPYQKVLGLPFPHLHGEVHAHLRVTFVVCNGDRLGQTRCGDCERV
jgi:hypothetical protein